MEAVFGGRSASISIASASTDGQYSENSAGYELGTSSPVFIEDAEGYLELPANQSSGSTNVTTSALKHPKLARATDLSSIKPPEPTFLSISPNSRALQSLDALTRATRNFGGTKISFAHPADRPSFDHYVYISIPETIAWLISYCENGVLDMKMLRLIISLEQEMVTAIATCKARRLSVARGRNLLKHIKQFEAEASRYASELQKTREAARDYLLKGSANNLVTTRNLQDSQYASSVTQNNLMGKPEQSQGRMAGKYISGTEVNVGNPSESKNGRGGPKRHDYESWQVEAPYQRYLTLRASSPHLH